MHVSKVALLSAVSCLLQLVSIVMINVVVLFVTLNIGVYSNWFIAGTMLICAIIMGEEIISIKILITIINNFFAVFVRPKLRRVKLDSKDDSKEISCWRVLSASRKGFNKASIQGHS